MNVHSTLLPSFWLIVLVFLPSCASQTVTLPPEMLFPTDTVIPAVGSPTPISTSTSTLVVINPSPVPTQPTVPLITPNSIQLERWKEYEVALKQSILPTWTFENLLCEWDILAQAGQDLYVWALCGSSKGTDMRPAVLHLRPDGSVRSVKILERGHPLDVDRLFPKEAQVKFRFYEGTSASNGRLREMLNHLYYRETHLEEPPLIVLSAMPAATPTQ